MFKLVMKHNELKDLSFSMKEFGQFMRAGDIRFPESYCLVLRVKVFGKLFYAKLGK